MTYNQARAVDIADEALAGIKAAGLTPDPTTFEVWFTYLSGYNQVLNREINALIDRRALSQDDVADIYNRHLSPNRHLHRLFAVGESLRDEARAVAGLVDTAFESADGYGLELQTASRQLDTTRDHANISKTIASLIQSTEDIKQTNSLLALQLKNSEAQIRQLQDSIEIMRLESMTDPLTAVANRKLFDHSLGQMVERAEVTGTPLSLIIADIDQFKDFNDRFGHQIGDDVLRLVAFSLKNSVRGGDLVARYGGDEFTILLPRTALRDALAVGENIRTAVMERELVQRSTKKTLGRVTLSVGVAQHEEGQPLDAVVERADRLLFAAKRNGRNCVMG